MPVYLLLRNEKERDKTPEVWQRYSGRLDKSVHHHVDITGSLLLFGKCDDTLVSPVPVGDLLHIAYRLNPPCISVSCILVEPALHQFHERIGNMLPVVRSEERRVGKARRPRR